MGQMSIISRRLSILSIKSKELVPVEKPQVDSVPMVTEEEVIDQDTMLLEEQEVHQDRMIVEVEEIELSSVMQFAPFYPATSTTLVS